MGSGNDELNHMFQAESQMIRRSSLQASQCRITRESFVATCWEADDAKVHTCLGWQGLLNDLGLPKLFAFRNGVTILDGGGNTPNPMASPVWRPMERRFNAQTTTIFLISPVDRFGPITRG